MGTKEGKETEDDENDEGTTVSPVGSAAAVTKAIKTAVSHMFITHDQGVGLMEGHTAAVERQTVLQRVREIEKEREMEKG